MAGVPRLTAVSVLVSVALVAPPAAAEPVVLGVGVQPSVAIDPAGTAYVAWLGGESSDKTLQFCRIPCGAAACDVRNESRIAAAIGSGREPAPTATRPDESAVAAAISSGAVSSGRPESAPLPQQERPLRSRLGTTH